LIYGNAGAFGRKYPVFPREEAVMAQNGELKTALSEAETWIDEFISVIGWHDRELAFKALVGGLHAFRDSLPWDEAANVSAYFPPVLRGYYFEGWHPASRSLPLAERAIFFERIRDAVHQEPGVEPEHVARALFFVAGAPLARI
jgi:uncharacterized protein (DUF2267 family)